MTLYHSSKTPTEVITESITSSLPEFAKQAMARDYIAALRSAGYIVVKENAIARAQREAIAAYLEDRQ